MKRFISIKELSKLTGKSERDLRRFCEQGIIPSKKIQRVEAGMLETWQIDTWQIEKVISKAVENKVKAGQEEEIDPMFGTYISGYEPGFHVTDRLDEPNLDYYAEKYFGDHEDK